MSTTAFLHDFLKTCEGDLRRAGAGLEASAWCRLYAPNPADGRLPWSFDGHEYQPQVLDDPHHDIVIMKGPQGGFTELIIWKVIAMLDHKLVKTCIYTMPRDTDVRDFARTRLKPMVNGCVRIQSGKRLDKTERDSTSVIGIGDRFMLIRPTFSERAAISVPAEMLVNDEFDRSKMSVCGTYLSRLSHARAPRVIRFSNPSDVGYGVDAAYHTSDQHVWMVKCPHCNHWQDMDWEPDEFWRADGDPFIMPRAQPDGESSYMYRCRNPHCARELRYHQDLNMQWVPKYQLPRVIDGRAHDKRGYHWLVTNAWAWKSADRVVNEFEQYRRESGIETAYNFGLGKPFRGEVSQLDPGEVRARQNFSLKWLDANTELTFALGADQGDNIHHLLGGYWYHHDDGRRIMRVVYADVHRGLLFDSVDKHGRPQPGRFSGLITALNPTICNMDAAPNLEASLIICRRYEGLVWRTFFDRHLKVILEWKMPDELDPDKVDYRVNVNHGLMLSHMVRNIREGLIEFAPLDDAPGGCGVDIVKQLCRPVCRRVIADDGVQYVWEGVKDAHFMTSLMYLYIALSGAGANVRRFVIKPQLMGL